MNIIYKTGRIYDSQDQVLHIQVCENEIDFSDHVRGIHGSVEIDDLTKELNIEFENTAKEWASYCLDHYDNGYYRISTYKIELREDYINV